MIDSDGVAIPRFGGKGVGFAGVELRESWLFVGSGAISFVAMFVIGWKAIFIGLIGYSINKQYLQWSRHHPPRFLRTKFYVWGVAGFTSAFNSPKKIFIGNLAARTGIRGESFQKESH